MYVERDIRKWFHKIFESYNIVALVGARQAGKTTFLKQQMKTIKSSYILFDDPDARELFEEDIKKFEIQYVNGYGLSVLDEVQYCKDAGRKLKYLVDTGRKLWITSSSEIMLGREILSYLVGRVSIIRLFPFDLNEYSRAKQQKSVTPSILRRLIWEHMTYGGYPKVVLTGEPEMKRTILWNLYETMLLKDVARTFNIDDIGALERLAKYLSLNIGGILSYDAVSTALSISFQTLKKYLDALEKSYLILLITPYFTNKSKELSKQPKIYFLDTGLRNAIAKVFDTDPDGKLFENYVLSELLKMGFVPKYWRTKAKAEVDFVIEKDSELIPIEVKLSARSDRIPRSLRSFIHKYRPENAIIVTYKNEGTDVLVINGCRITFTDVMGLKGIFQAPLTQVS